MGCNILLYMLKIYFLSRRVLFEIIRCSLEQLVSRFAFFVLACFINDCVSSFVASGRHALQDLGKLF